MRLNCSEGRAYRRFLEIPGSVGRQNWSCEWRSVEGLNCRAGSNGSAFRSPNRSPGKSETIPLEGGFPGPGQIINHHRMRKFRGIYGANHVWGTTAAHNNPLASAPRRDAHHLSISVAKTADLPRRPEIQTRVKRALLQILAQSPFFLSTCNPGLRAGARRRSPCMCSGYNSALLFPMFRHPKVIVHLPSSCSIIEVGF
jgi:hypothetical protein